MEDWDGIAKTIGFADETSMLTYFYVKEQLSIVDIGVKLGAGAATIAQRLHKCKIQTRSRGGANNSHTKTRALFRMDQRLVFSMKETDLAKLVEAHQTSVYKYKRSVTGGHKAWSSAR